MRFFVIVSLFVVAGLAITCYEAINNNGYRPPNDRTTCSNSTADFCFKETWKNATVYQTTWGCQAGCQAQSWDKGGVEFHHYCCKKDKCNSANSPFSVFFLVVVALFAMVQKF
ncbi:unnamed protein product, partial [Mesorhabditis belari]|uniref:Snake toxin/toxin-like domain-containing protein n=1 Tax=Mesorhabditis belari TaxID=2138241 RepID=A0AAF3EL57_9BILA